jgi:Leucine-rich repeat (LRR) protein
MHIKILSLVFLVGASFATGCSRSTKENIFGPFADKEEVYINLEQFGLDSLPREINQLQKVKTLVVSRRAMKSRVIYPPPEKMTFWVDKPPFRSLPNELAGLTGLEQLTLHKLSIKTLPENFGNLENLVYLELSGNKLTIAREIEKLQRLKKLRYLGLVGNKLDTSDLRKLHTALPLVRIDHQLDVAIEAGQTFESE